MHRWQSIGLRLPLLISALLLVIVGTFSSLAYRQVEDAVLTAGGERLLGASHQLAAILGGSIEQIEERGIEAAGEEAILQYLENPGAASPAAAEEALREAAGTGTAAQNALIELWSAEGERLIVIGDSPFARRFELEPVRPPEPGVSALRTAGAFVYFEVAAPVFAEAGGAGEAGEAGRIVQRRALSVGQTGQLLAELIGPEARFLMGNRDGGVWTDLSEVVPGPAGPIRPDSSVVAYDSPELGRRLAAVAPIEGTPWLTWVELPRSSVVAPARAFLGQLIGTAMLLVLLGTLAAIWLSRSMTGPLARLATAARGLAGGDYTQQIETSRKDELGLLTESFNTMTRQVAMTHQELEEKVEERTTELREAYAQLSEAQDALVRREKLAILGQLASGVGHELRNPLGVMTNAVYYLEMILSEAPESVTEYLGILRTQIGLSEKIVSDLLDFGRVKDPKLEPVDLDSLVRDQVERLGPLEDVTVRQELPEDLPPAMVDATQIGQVVLNLVLNGAQAMSEVGGVLTVRGFAEADRVSLEVEDEGSGIAPENLGRIFEPLFTTKARGIGLGLAVSRALVEANEGELTARSPDGAGAVFTLSLPTAAGRGES